MKRDGVARTVLLEVATIPEVTAATRAILTKKGTSRAKPSEVAGALVAALAKTKALVGVTVHEHAGFLTFQHVPIAALGAFGKTVAAHRGET